MCTQKSVCFRYFESDLMYVKINVVLNCDFLFIEPHPIHPTQGSVI